MLPEMNRLQELFHRIQKVTNTPQNNLMKAIEELGELSTQLLIDAGTIDKPSEEGVIPEACDVIVSMLAIVANFTDDIDTIFPILEAKVSKWEANVAKRQVSKIETDSKSSEPRNPTCKYCGKVLSLGNQYCSEGCERSWHAHHCKLGTY